MSNNQVGSVYAKIIEEVIGQCRAPFEFEGAPEQVLEDFRKTWQARISEKKVAEMPWDPKPAPPPPVVAPPNPRQAPQTYVAPTQQPLTNGDVKVKVEQNDLANLASATPTYTQYNPNVASQNAAQQIKDQFGDAASASIQQLNGRITDAPHGIKRPLPQGSPTQDQFDVKRRVTDYDRNLQQQAQQRMQQLSAAQRQAGPPVGSAQTDGAADWKQMVAERRALAAEGTEAADMSIAERVAVMQRAEEGGGVMQPHSKNLKRPIIRLTNAEAGSSSAGPAAFDGADDDDDEDDDAKPDADDADAINSDLDDDEEENLEEDDDERSGEIMVCTYEKVARVKNKWKCTLKDGILITGGKEYVFGKATGEFEW